MAVGLPPIKSAPPPMGGGRGVYVPPNIRKWLEQSGTIRPETLQGMDPALAERVSKSLDFYGPPPQMESTEIGIRRPGETEPAYRSRMLAAPQMQVNFTKGYQAPDYTPTFFEDPRRVARMYHLVQSTPVGQPLPPWLDRNAVVSAYKYFENRYGGKPWYQWGYLDADDPARQYLQSIKTPPPELLDPALRQQEWILEQTIKNDPRYKMEQQVVAPEEQPLWMRTVGSALTSPAMSGAMTMAPWAIGATFVGGPVAGLSALGAGALLGLASEKSPTLASVLQFMNIPAAEFEKLVGVLNQALGSAIVPGEAGTMWEEGRPSEVMPAAYKASAAAYEAAGAQLGLARLGNIFQALENQAINILPTSAEEALGLHAAPLAKMGQVWQLGIPQPVTVEGAMGLAALRDARRAIMGGASPQEVVQDLQYRFGWDGQSADLIFQTLADPLNVVQAYGNQMFVAPLADAVGAGRLAEAARSTHGLAQASAMYHQSLRTGLGINIPPLDPAAASKLPAIARFIGGVTRDGMLKDLTLPRWSTPLLKVGQKLPLLGLQEWFGYLLNLTPASRGRLALGISSDNFGILADRVDMDPERLVMGVKKVGASPPEAAAEYSMRTLGSVEGYQVGMMWRDFGQTADAKLHEWQVSEPNRRMLFQVGGILGMTPDDVLALIGKSLDDADAVVRQLMEKAKAADNPNAKAFLQAAERGEVTGAALKDMFKLFEVDGIPYDPVVWKSELHAALIEHTAQWAIKAYGIGPDPKFVQLAQAMKGAQSLVLLGLNPGYLANNFINGEVRMAEVGAWGLWKPGRIAKLWERIGFEPYRLGQGFGAADVLDGVRDAGEMEIRKATMDDAGKIGELNRAIRGVSNKASPFLKAAQVVERWQSRRAMTQGALNFLARFMRVGVGIDRMPPSLERALSQIDPNLPPIIHGIIEGSMNPRELMAGLFTGVARNVQSFLPEIAGEIGIDPADAAAMLAQAGVTDFLAERLRPGMSDDQKRAVFDELENELGAELENRYLAEIENRAKEAAVRVLAGRDAEGKLDGSKAFAEVVNLLDETVLDDLRWHNDHFIRWAETFYETAGMSKRARNARFAVEMARANRFARHNRARIQATWAGILKGLNDGGLAAPDSMVASLNKLGTLWDGFFKVRDEKLRAFFDGEFESQEARDAAWSKIETELGELYKEHNAQEMTLNAAIDKTLAAWTKKLVGADAAKNVAAKRARLLELRRTVQKAMEEFRESLKGKTSAERRQAWHDFNNKVNLPLLAERAGIEMGAMRPGVPPVAPAPTGPVQPPPEVPPVRPIPEEPGRIPTEGLEPIAIRLDAPGFTRITPGTRVVVTDGPFKGMVGEWKETDQAGIWSETHVSGVIETGQENVSLPHFSTEQLAFAPDDAPLTRPDQWTKARRANMDAAKAQAKAQADAAASAAKMADLERIAAAEAQPERRPVNRGRLQELVDSGVDLDTARQRVLNEQAESRAQTEAPKPETVESTSISERSKALRQLALDQAGIRNVRHLLNFANKHLGLAEGERIASLADLTPEQHTRLVAEINARGEERRTAEALAAEEAAKELAEKMARGQSLPLAEAVAAADFIERTASDEQADELRAIREAEEADTKAGNVQPERQAQRANRKREIHRAVAEQSTVEPPKPPPPVVPSEVERVQDMTLKPETGVDENTWKKSLGAIQVPLNPASIAEFPAWPAHDITQIRASLLALDELEKTWDPKWGKTPIEQGPDNFWITTIRTLRDQLFRLEKSYATDQKRHAAVKVALPWIPDADGYRPWRWLSNVSREKVKAVGGLYGFTLEAGALKGKRVWSDGYIAVVGDYQRRPNYPDLATVDRQANAKGMESIINDAAERVEWVTKIEYRMRHDSPNGGQVVRLTDAAGRVVLLDSDAYSVIRDIYPDAIMSLGQDDRMPVGIERAMSARHVVFWKGDEIVAVAMPMSWGRDRGATVPNEWIDTGFTFEGDGLAKGAMVGYGERRGKVMAVIETEGQPNRYKVRFTDGKSETLTRSQLDRLTDAQYRGQEFTPAQERAWDTWVRGVKIGERVAVEHEDGTVKVGTLSRRWATWPHGFRGADVSYDDGSFEAVNLGALRPANDVSSLPAEIQEVAKEVQAQAEVEAIIANETDGDAATVTPAEVIEAATMPQEPAPEIGEKVRIWLADAIKDGLINQQYIEGLQAYGRVMLDPGERQQAIDWLTHEGHSQAAAIVASLDAIEQQRAILAEPNMKNMGVATRLGAALWDWAQRPYGKRNMAKLVAALTAPENAGDLAQIQADTQATLDRLYPGAGMIHASYYGDLAPRAKWGYLFKEPFEVGQRAPKGKLWALMVPKDNVLATGLTHPSLFAGGENVVLMNGQGFEGARLLTVDGRRPTADEMAEWVGISQPVAEPGPKVSAEGETPIPVEGHPDWMLTPYEYQMLKAQEITTRDGGIPILNADDRKAHENIVRAALRNGDPVPDRVLREYPHLADRFKGADPDTEIRRLVKALDATSEASNEAQRSGDRELARSLDNDLGAITTALGDLLIRKGHSPDELETEADYTEILDRYRMSEGQEAELSKPPTEPARDAELERALRAALWERLLNYSPETEVTYDMLQNDFRIMLHQGGIEGYSLPWEKLRDRLGGSEVVDGILRDVLDKRKNLPPSDVVRMEPDQITSTIVDATSMRWVARVPGGGTLEGYWATPDRPAVLQNIVVPQGQRGKGKATEMFRWFLGEVVSRGASEFIVTTPSADGVKLNEAMAAKGWITDAGLYRPDDPKMAGARRFIINGPETRAPEPAPSVEVTDLAGRGKDLMLRLAGWLERTEQPLTREDVETQARDVGLDLNDDTQASMIYDAQEAAINRAMRNERRGWWVKKSGDATAHDWRSLIDRIKNAAKWEGRLVEARRTLQKSELQQFSTPLPIAEAAAYAADVRYGEHVLEPEAGTANLVEPLYHNKDIWIDVNELDPGRRSLLAANGWSHISDLNILTDFVFDDAGQLLPREWSAVIHNPPWGAYSTGRYGKPVAMKAFTANDWSQRFYYLTSQRVAPGGRVVTILPTNVVYTRDRVSGTMKLTGSSFRGWLDANYYVRAIIESPPGAYKTRATDVGSILLVVDHISRPSDAAAPIEAWGDTAPKSWEEYADLVRELGREGERVGTHARPQEFVNATRTGMAQAGRSAASQAEPLPTSPGRSTAPEPGGVAEGRPAGAGLPPSGEGLAGVLRSDAGQRQDIRSAADPAGGGNTLSAGMVAEPGGNDYVEPPPARDLVPGRGAQLAAERSKPYIEQARAAVSQSDGFTHSTFHPRERVSPHPRPVVEAKSIAGIAPPEFHSYEIHADAQAARERGAVSDDQHTAAQIIGWANDHGFGHLNAYGTGTGKGRILAYTGYDWIARGRSKRLLMLTAREENVADLLQELRNVGSGRYDDAGVWREGGEFPYRVIVLKGMPLGELPAPDDPTIYIGDYFDLKKYADDILKLDIDGLLADEAHTAKNIEGSNNPLAKLLPMMKGKGSATGRVWTVLHEQLLARRKPIAYFTATPAEDVGELAYLYGLGLWKDIKGFKAWTQFISGQMTEEAFKQDVARGAISAFRDDAMRALLARGEFEATREYNAGSYWNPKPQKITMHKGSEFGYTHSKGGRVFELVRAFMSDSGEIWRTETVHNKLGRFTSEEEAQAAVQLLHEKAGTDGYRATAIFEDEWGKLGIEEAAASGQVQAEAIEVLSQPGGGSERQKDSGVAFSPALTEQVMRELKSQGRFSNGELWRGGLEYELVQAEKANTFLREQFDDLAALYKEIEVTFKRWAKTTRNPRAMFGVRSQLQNDLRQRLGLARLQDALDRADTSLAEGRRVVLSVEYISELESERGNLASAIDAIPTRMALFDEEGKSLVDEAGNLQLGDQLDEALLEVIGLREKAKQLARSMPSPLQVILDKYGRENIAFITGQPAEGPRLNIDLRTEINKWNTGNAKICVLSKRGGTGLSLHDKLGKPGTGEPWPIDLIFVDYDWKGSSVLQRIGRVDRADQKSRPRIFFPHSEMALEKKFLSTIAGRLQSIGATSRGGTTAVATGDFDNFNYATPFHLAALRLAWESFPDNLKGAFKWRDSTGDVPDELPSAVDNTNKFMIELMFMPMELGNMAFDLWMETVKALEGSAKHQERLAMLSGSSRGSVLRSSDFQRQDGQPLAMHEVQDAAGHRSGVLSGVFLDKLNEIRKVFSEGSYGGELQGVRWIHFTDDKTSNIIAGIEVPPTKLERLAKFFGRSLLSDLNPDNALAALHAGHRIAIQSDAPGRDWVLRMRKDGFIEIDGAGMKSKDELQAAGATYNVKGFWHVPTSSLVRFLERYRIIQRPQDLGSGGGTAYPVSDMWNMKPAQHGEFLSSVPSEGTYVVPIQIRRFAGQEISASVYRNRILVAYVPAGSQLGQFFDTATGPQRILGIDPREGTSWVVESADGKLREFPIVQGGAVETPDLPDGAIAKAAAPRYTMPAEQEMWNEGIFPIISSLKEKMLRPENSTTFRMADLSPELAGELHRYLDKVKGQMADVKLGAVRWGENRRDAALLNYTRRYGWDNVLGAIYPYEFFYTRSMANSLIRILDRPNWYAAYARVRNMQRNTLLQPGFPSRLRNKVRIPIPWLPEWAGGGVWIDPMRQLFPMEPLFRPFEQYAQEETKQADMAMQILGEWAGQDKYDPAKIKATIANRSGPLWDQAMAQAANDMERETDNPFDFMNLLMSPALPISWGINIWRGTPEKIGPLPPTRMIQAATSLASTHLLGKPSAGINIEAPLRKALGWPEWDQYGQYRIDRQISNMAAEGVDVSLVLRAMVEKSGPIYEEAKARAGYEQATSAAGGWLGLPANIFPDGEQEQRRIKPQFDAAYDEFNKTGNKAALSTFFERYPEYEARLALYDDPETRLRQFLVDQVWNGYNALGRTDKATAREALGELFDTAFLSKETRSYDALDPATLAAWARYLHQQPPETPETMAEPPGVVQMMSPAMQQGGVPWMDPTLAAGIDDYKNLRDKLFPNWYAVQSRYFDIPESDRAGRRAYRAAFPSLGKMWDWENEYLTSHQEIIPYVKGEGWELRPVKQGSIGSGLFLSSEAIQEFTPPLVDQLRLHFTANQTLSTGALAELRRIWQATGSPGDFKEWVNETVYNSLTVGR